MTTARTTLGRLLPALAALTLLLSLAAAAPPPRAAAEGFEETVFRGDFDGLPAGALGAAPVAVEIGRVLAAPAPVNVATVSGLDGRALSVTGAGAAELRFSSYPGPLPQALNSQRYELRVRANLVAPAANAKGASLYLATAGGQRFEIVGFGADGKLARGGKALSLAYSAGGRVRVDARFDLKNGTMRLDLSTSAGDLPVEGVSLPGAFNPDTAAALVYAAGGAAGAYGVDAVEVKVQKEDEDDDRPPPARIVITPPANNTAIIEVVNGVTIINFNIVILNSGGRSNNTTLILDLDDDLLEILDLSWLSGLGYVKEIKGGQIIIGVGENNVVHRNSPHSLKFKFKLKARRDGGEFKLDIKYRLRYNDSGGRRETQPIVIIIIVPPAGTTPTPVPATATPTVTGTPPTATPTSAPPTATPTVTGTPPTVAPTETAPAATLVPFATPTITP